MGYLLYSQQNGFSDLNPADFFPDSLANADGDWDAALAAAGYEKYKIWPAFFCGDEWGMEAFWNVREGKYLLELYGQDIYATVCTKSYADLVAAWAALSNTILLPIAINSMYEIQKNLPRRQ